ncbi:MAG: hypothetical protein A3H32_16610 [Betaproteobacteria bacterium RIFCSPLOWO2_02_FULL_63_19]|nr:MAG: hypothetical protein A3H32_16610 [Betaproteobacteria bacterium RIFCSPLOWO2_02_FULL_63_19]
MSCRWVVRLALSLIAIVGATASVAAELDIPDLSLDVATRRQEDGRVGKWIHEFRLRCEAGTCNLTVMTLNQCVESVPGAPINVQIYRQEVGELRVSRRDSDTLVVEFDHLSGTSRLRIGFERVQVGAYLRGKVTSFSGGYIDRSARPGRMAFVEYVPLQGRYSNVTLDCKLELPGIEK